MLDTRYAISYPQFAIRYILRSPRSRRWMKKQTQFAGLRPEILSPKPEILNHEEQTQSAMFIPIRQAQSRLCG